MRVYVGDYTLENTSLGVRLTQLIDAEVKENIGKKVDVCEAVTTQRAVNSEESCFQLMLLF